MNSRHGVRIVRCGVRSIAGIALLGGCVLAYSADDPGVVPVSRMASEAGQSAVPAIGLGQAQVSERDVLARYCLTCHNQRLRTAGLDVGSMTLSGSASETATWEKVVKRLRRADMPPAGMPRPDAATYAAMVTRIESTLDAAAAAHPDPGVAVARRLTRFEYENAVRDLLDVDVDSSLLPFDATNEGFDNMAGGLSVSPMLAERYENAARRISRLAVGDPTIGPALQTRTYQLPTQLYQTERMSDDLPFGSRGGLAVHHLFPLDGEYVVRLTLQRNVYDFIRGLQDSHDLDVRLDGHRIRRFAIGGESKWRPAPLSFSGSIDTAGGTSMEWTEYEHTADAGLEFRFAGEAGSHVLSASFVGRLWEPEGVLLPLQTGFGMSADESRTAPIGRGEPAIQTMSVTGPYNAAGVVDTESRRRIFVCHPRTPSDESGCAKKILSSLARRAFRRPVADADVSPLLKSYEAARRDRDGFEAAIQQGVEQVLMDPEFLFRVEGDVGAKRAAQPVTEVDLASRLSFFLWSSIPDDELLALAEKRKLRDAGVLERQVANMLANARASALVENFASQWLELRKLKGQAPNPELFPDFDDNLRRSMEQETLLFVESQLREDHSIPELLTADYTFLNERLAKHYGIPGVYGSRFRRVTLPDGQRRGLLGQASILTVTSYGNRTSPVLRGKWLLDNVFGAPPPPPPPNVPGLEDSSASVRRASVRERMEQHRKNPVCASCHVRMDPLGFALEHYDAVGRFRATDETGPIDAFGSLPGGAKFAGLEGVRSLALREPGEFATTVIEKLLTYALGRGLEPQDMPAVRAIRAAAAAHDYRWSSVILGVVKSVPFQMRRSDS